MRDVDEEPGMADRLSEMELRLERMEHERSMSGRSRSFVNRIVPPEAGAHFRAAGREQLMGVRALVDHWIRRLDAQQTAGPVEREEITIE